MLKQERIGYEAANLRLTIPKNGSQVSDGDEIAVTLVWANSDPSKSCIALIADTPLNANVPVHFGAHAAMLYTCQSCRKFKVPTPTTWFVLTAKGAFGAYDRNQECIKPIVKMGWDPGSMDSFIRTVPMVQALWYEHVLLVEQHFAYDIPRLANWASALDQQCDKGVMLGQGATIVDAGNLAAATVTYLSSDMSVVGVKRDQVPLVHDTEWNYRLAVYAPAPFGQQELFMLDPSGHWVAGTNKARLLVGARIFGAPATTPDAPFASNTGRGQNIFK